MPLLSRTEFDLVIIGSGPAGQKAALQAANLKKSVLIIEKWHLLGGGSAHWGTLPSKSFRESVYRFGLSSRGQLALESAEKGDKNLKAAPRPEMQRLLQRKDRVVKGEAQVLKEQFARNCVEVVRGAARFVSAHELEVTPPKGSPVRVRGQKILVAVGARPVAPPHLPVDGRFILDSDSILSLKKLPQSLVVLGAGIIGCEYASMFSTAGTRVTLVDRRNQILASVDREIVSKLMERFEAQKMQILLETDAEKIVPVMKKGKQVGVRVQLPGGKRILADAVLIAQGRVGNTEDLGLEAAGLNASDRGLLTVNTHFQTAVPHIYAAGDVIGAPALASTSMEQGRLAASHALGAKEEPYSSFFPYGIYTIPEISMVGPTEEELKSKGIEYLVGRAPYHEVARGQIVGDRWGLLKLLADKKTGKLLAVHIIGDSAADLVHIGQTVMAFGGTLDYFICNVFNYPTLAEAYKMAAFHALSEAQ